MTDEMFDAKLREMAQEWGADQLYTFDVREALEPARTGGAE